MRHIEEYNKLEWILEDLSEYLQEVFDKHHIQQMSEKNWSSQSGFTNSAWYISKNHISITKIEDFNTLEYDLEKMKPLLEKRIGYRLDIEYYESISSLSIYLLKNDYQFSKYRL